MEQPAPVLTEALVGRRRELPEARAAVDAALRGSAGPLLISGEAGIGKTRLIEALTAECGARTMWGECWGDPGTPAFWPWTAVLRECLASYDVEPPEDLAAIVEGRALGGGPAQQLRLRLFDDVASYVSAVARIEPVVFVLEDLHVADQASLDLFRFLGTALRQRPVALVGSHRYPDLEPDRPLAGALDELRRGARVITLAGLPDRDVGALIEATTGRAPTGQLAARVCERTAGNPLFVIEVGKLLTSRADADVKSLPIPPTVRQAIVHRLSYLSGGARELLEHACVIGQVFPDTLLARLAGVDPGTVADHLDEAGQAGLVRALPSVGRFVFTHALVRDALYQSLPPALRRARHRRIAEALETEHDLDDHVTELADHYQLALPDADAARALDYRRRAGRRALARLAYEEAADHFARAVELAGLGAANEADRVELLLALGDAQGRAGDWTRAQEAYDEVAISARRNNRPDQLARAALGFGAGLSGFEVRLFDEAQLTLLRQALEVLPDDATELRAWVSARLSVAESFLVEAEQRVERSRAAVTAAKHLGDPKLRVYALSTYCDAIAGPAHTAERLRLADEMVRLASDAEDLEGELLGRRFRLVALLESGDISGVEAEVEQFDRIARRLRWPLVAWCPRLWRGTLALIEGQLDVTERLVAEVEDIGRRAGSVNAEIVAAVQRLQLLLEQGRPEEAYQVLLPLVDDPEGGPNADAWRALPLARMGRHAEARGLLGRLTAEGFQLVQDGAWLEVIASVAEACAEVGHREAARLLLPIVTPYADRFVTGGLGAICFGSMHRFAGLLAHCAGDLELAGAHFRSAAAANRRAGATLLVAHTLRQHAAVLSDRAAADAMRAEADETYRQLGLDHWTAQPDSGPNVFRPDGDTWCLRYEGQEARVRDTKGLATLARLLAESGRDFHVFDLVAGPEPGPRPAGGTGEVIDEQARQAYRHRLSELETELDEATLANDPSRGVRLQQEYDALVNELTKAFGLGGRARHDNDPVDRARSTVTKRIRGAIAHIEQEHPVLGQHLRNSVRTGRYCSYAPERPVDWDLA